MSGHGLAFEWKQRHGDNIGIAVVLDGKDCVTLASPNVINGVAMVFVEGDGMVKLERLEW